MKTRESERGGAAPNVCSQTRRKLAKSKPSKTTFRPTPVSCGITERSLLCSIKSSLMRDFRVRSSLPVARHCSPRFERIPSASKPPICGLCQARRVLAQPRVDREVFPSQLRQLMRIRSTPRSARIPRATPTIVLLIISHSLPICKSCRKLFGTGRAPYSTADIRGFFEQPHQTLQCRMAACEVVEHRTTAPVSRTASCASSRPAGLGPRHLRTRAALAGYSVCGGQRAPLNGLAVDLPRSGAC